MKSKRNHTNTESNTVDEIPVITDETNEIRPKSMRLYAADSIWFENYASKHVNVAQAFRELVRKSDVEIDTTEIDSLREANKALTLQVEELLNKAPEVKEVEKLVPVELSHNQFIIELTPEFLAKTRKLRDYLKSKHKIPTQHTEQEYIASLALHSFEYVFMNEYKSLFK